MGIMEWIRDRDDVSWMKFVVVCLILMWVFGL